jgi:serine protease Do
MNTARLTLALLSVFVGLATAATPDADLQKRVRAATFEVVVPKPPETGVTYERAAPFELLPFTERNDKFWPVGTAFAIGEDTFVSAAHVLQSALGGIAGPPVLRGADGKTHAISRVVKFSAHQDFVVFTTDERFAKTTLETSRDTSLDQPVHAVGNALGEGVVIRDGLLTSLTPEDQDGRWKWLRYSAATSPGNSGGPLLNSAGKVIGIVIGKSPGENLNYALPIEHVLDAPDVARVDMRFPLRIPILQDSIIARYDFTLPLPATLADFSQRYFAEQNRLLRSERARLLAEQQSGLFPRGKSGKLLASVEKAYCPMLVVQNDEREWVADGTSRETTDLPDEGSITARTAGGYAMFSIDRGKADAARFFADRRAAMDAVLKALKLRRRFGTEEVTITSIGAPRSESSHRDRFGRNWVASTFALPFYDGHFVVLFTPTPQGYAGMAMFAPRASLEGVAEALRFFADWVYLSYDGTLPQWREFLARADRPAPLADVKLSRDAQGVHFRSPRIDVDVAPTALTLDDAAMMQLLMSYSLKDGNLSWDIGAVYVSNGRDDKRYVGFIRQPKPPEAAGKEINDRWREMLSSTGAFVTSRGSDADGKKFWRRVAIGANHRPGATVDPQATFLYEMITGINDARLPREIDDMQDRLLENVRVKGP